jgi:hypothetical protein
MEPYVSPGVYSGGGLPSKLGLYYHPSRITEKICVFYLLDISDGEKIFGMPFSISVLILSLHVPPLYLAYYVTHPRLFQQPHPEHYVSLDLMSIANLALLFYPLHPSHPPYKIDGSVSFGKPYLPQNKKKDYRVT